MAQKGKPERLNPVGGRKNYGASVCSICQHPNDYRCSHNGMSARERERARKRAET